MGSWSQAITSGAIQYGVPMNVFLLPMVLSNWADTPKSTAMEEEERGGSMAGNGCMAKVYYIYICTQLDVCIVCEQNVLPLDVTVDNLVLMEVT